MIEAQAATSTGTITIRAYHQATAQFHPATLTYTAIVAQAAPSPTDRARFTSSLAAIVTSTIQVPEVLTSRQSTAIRELPRTSTFYVLGD
jgi:hypothetical protein